MVSINKLIKQLKHKNVEKRIAAAKALGELKDGRAMMPLMSAATKEDDLRALEAMRDASMKITYKF